MAYEEFTNYADPKKRAMALQDENLEVSFYSAPEIIKKAIMVEGVKAGEEEHEVISEFIRISIPGDQKTVIEEHVTDAYRHRFANKYWQWKNNQESGGTPIEELELHKDILKELTYRNYRFVEQLANSPDHIIGALSGGHGLRVRARAYLERGKVSAELVIKEQQIKLEGQQAQIDELRALVDKLAGGNRVASK